MNYIERFGGFRMAKTSLHQTLLADNRELRKGESLDVTAESSEHQKLPNVLSSITDGLLVLDKDWRYTYCNEQGARMIGMRVEQLLGQCVWDLFPHTVGTNC